MAESSTSSGSNSRGLAMTARYTNDRSRTNLGTHRQSARDDELDRRIEEALGRLVPADDRRGDQVGLELTGTDQRDHLRQQRRRVSPPDVELDSPGVELAHGERYLWRRAVVRHALQHAVRFGRGDRVPQDGRALSA